MSKITEYEELTVPIATDMLVIVDDPGGTPITKKVEVGNLLSGAAFRSYTGSTQGLGASPDVFVAGFYKWAVADVTLDQGSLTQVFGTATVSYAAHAFMVAGGVGIVDTGVVGLRVNGVSIDDAGTRTPGDTEVLSADITTLAANQYLETAMKWLGTVTYELYVVSGTPTAYTLDFNYGLAKYDDWGNRDFTITDIEAVGFAGANDVNFDIKLLHHRTTNWVYDAAAFTPIAAANTIASLVGDHVTDDQLGTSEHFAWRRVGLSEAINGDGVEGFLILISSTANNAVEYLNIHIGANV